MMQPLKQSKATCSRIKIVSQERITDELNKIILSPKPSIGFNYLFDTGLLHIIFPQMVALYGVEIINGKGHKDNFYHTLQVLDNICETTTTYGYAGRPFYMILPNQPPNALKPGHGWTFHGHEDKGARMVPKIFAQLKLPLNEKMKLVQKLVQLHLRPIVLAQSIVTDSAVRRLLFEAGEDIEGLMLLCKADITTKNEYKVKKYRNNFELVQQN
jgi:poly(A) polymerase